METEKPQPPQDYSIFFILFLLPVSYFFISKILNSTIRFLITFSACIIAITLSSLLPPLYFQTMMSISLSWMVSIKLINLMMLPLKERANISFLSFMCEFFWFAFPITKNKNKLTSVQIVVDTFQNIIIILVKMLLLSWMYNYLFYCMNLDKDEHFKNDYHYLCLYTFLFFLWFGCGSYMNDIYNVIVTIVTLGNYSVTPFNNFALLSRTPREFWSKRYNLVVNSLFRQSIFVPLREQLQWSSSSAAFAVFIVSGLLHMHVGISVFNTNGFSSLMFFLLHGVACYSESFILKPLPTFLSILLTQIFFILTAPLYLGLFVKNSPQWLINNQAPSSMLPIELPTLTVCPKLWY